MPKPKQYIDCVSRLSNRYYICVICVYEDMHRTIISLMNSPVFVFRYTHIHIGGNLLARLLIPDMGTLLSRWAHAAVERESGRERDIVCKVRAGEKQPVRLMIVLTVWKSLRYIDWLLMHIIGEWECMGKCLALAAAFDWIKAVSFFYGCWRADSACLLSSTAFFELNFSFLEIIYTQRVDLSQRLSK